MYLVKINFKKEFSIPVEQFLPFFYFVRQFYGRGSNRVIPTVEKWVPNSGFNLLIPSLQHDEYPSHIDIFTKFKELTPKEILAVFKEMVNSPGYVGSPFTSMIESELLNTETIETSIADTHLEKNIIEDIEEKFDME